MIDQIIPSKFWHIIMIRRIPDLGCDIRMNARLRMHKVRPHDVFPPLLPILM